jgi:hypothetical protein
MKKVVSEEDSVSSTLPRILITPLWKLDEDWPQDLSKHSVTTCI